MKLKLESFEQHIFPFWKLLIPVLLLLIPSVTLL